MTGEDFDPRTGKRIPKKKKKAQGPSIVDKMLAKKGPISREAMRAKMQGGAGGKKLPPITLLVTDKNGGQITASTNRKAFLCGGRGTLVPLQATQAHIRRYDRMVVDAMMSTETRAMRYVNVARTKVVLCVRGRNNSTIDRTL